ncbi:hypothetical protein Bca4012_053130 [Brassica carinata]|uniref:Uncharacterized protein n=3 Tax=Brassica TaxID=3705 RepID=A0A8X7R8F0_BRACI|nr:hypothetical protein Bca52824_055684 [Brassica carinata]
MGSRSMPRPMVGHNMQRTKPAYNFPAQAGMNPIVPLPQKRVMAQPHQQKEEGSWNGYKSGEHRVTMDTVRTRLSWPVFAEPNLDHVVGPLAELVIDDAPKFKPYVYREYKFLKMNKLSID